MVRSATSKLNVSVHSSKERENKRVKRSRCLHLAATSALEGSTFSNREVAVVENRRVEDWLIHRLATKRKDMLTQGEEKRDKQQVSITRPAHFQLPPSYVKLRNFLRMIKTLVSTVY